MTHTPVEEIKRKIGIEEVVGSYIELKQAGKTLKALCPFHSEKTPSFTVSTERQSFYCFGCNRGGDIFTFVEEFEGVDFKGALKILAEKAGVDIRQYRGTQDAKDSKEKLEHLYSLLDTAKELYCNALKMNPVAENYVLKRGITKESIARFEIGFAPDMWSYMYDELISRKFKKEDILKAGLIIEKAGGGQYDRFRNRIMFPIADSPGRVVAFSGRTLDVDKKVAKYINSPETDLFKKRDVLYGIDKAKLSIRKLGFSILVEGQVDLVLSHQAGFRNTVATSGTALRGREDEGRVGISNLELIKRISRNIVIAFDSDEAGILATIKNAQLALSLGMDVKVAVLPPGSDPADVILRGSQEWKKIIRESKDAVEFQLAIIQNRAKDKKALLKSIQQELFETIQMLPSKVDQEHYLTIISESIGISKDTLVEEFNNSKNRKASDKVVWAKDSVLKEKNKEVSTPDELLLLATLIDVFSKNPESKKGDPEKYQADFEEIYGQIPQKIVTNADPREKEKYYLKIEEENRNVANLKSLIDHLLKRNRIKELERKAGVLLSELRSAEKEAEKDVATDLFSKYSAILKNIEELKQSYES